MDQLLRTMQRIVSPSRGTDERRSSLGRSRIAVGLFVGILLLSTLAVFPGVASLSSEALAAPARPGGTESPPPILSFNATPNPTEVGVHSELAVTVLGNVTVGDTFSYLGLPAGCASQNTSTLSCTPSDSWTFNVTVSVTNLLGLVQKSLDWTVRATLQATINATASSTPLSVSFHGIVKGGVSLAQIAWKFGDGATSTGSLFANHTYAAAGTYRVSLEVVDDLAVSVLPSDNLTLSVPIGGLVAVASDSGTTGPNPLSVSFSGSASGGTGPYSFAWSFGDGDHGSGPNPIHNYTAQGEFDAVLTVTDAASVSTEASVVVEVLAPLGSFAATLSTNVTMGTAPLSVSFEGEARGGIAPYTYLWAFGDGSATVTGNATAHTYSTPGAFEATVTVVDGAGATTQAHVALLAGSPSGALTASASAFVSSGRAPFLASFAASAVGGTAPYVFSWNFGDGSADVNGSLVAHLYAQTGTFLATLSVADGDGNVTTAHAVVSVLGSEVGAFEVNASTSVTSGVAPLTVGFNATVTGGVAPYLYLWSFGNGSASTEVEPVVTYTAAGSYSASLVVTDATGATALSYVSVQVLATASGLSVGASPHVTATAPMSETVSFAASVHGGIAPYVYAWSFGDGSARSAVSAPTHVFTSSGDFSVDLAVTDATGASAAYDLNLVVLLSGLLVITSAVPASGSANVTWNFQAATAGGNGPYNYTWNFGDGTSTGAGAALTHTYAMPGTYLVVVTATDAQGNASVHDLFVVVPTTSTSALPAEFSPLVAIGAAAALGVFLGVLSLRRARTANRSEEAGAPAAEAAPVGATEAVEEAQFERASDEKDGLEDMY
jgi:PKD repeat protein